MRNLDSACPDSFMRFGSMVRMLLPDISELAATVHSRTYMEDGLITRHTASFLDDPHFCEAFRCGKDTKSWGRSNPRWRVYVACWAAASVASLEGDFAECGVNRGGLARSIIAYLDFNSLHKRFFLLDTYCGFPEGAQRSE